MAEFSRVQLIVQEDVGKSLVALRSDLLASCSAFIMDVGRVMDVPPADPRLALLEASLERFRRQASLKFDLPLAEMDAAAVDITAFMNARLQELSSRSELPDLIEEAARLMDRHNNRVWELVRNPDLGLSEVYSRVLVGLLARQPIEANLFPGILEGLAGNLGLSPAGTVNPPRSRQEGMMRRWAITLRQAAYDPSDTGQGSASSTTPLGLHLDYSMEFRLRRVGDIPPALTSSLLPSFPFLEKPRPGEPPSPPAAQQPEETDSPQSPLPDEEGEADIQPHRQKMLVQFPSRRGRPEENDRLADCPPEEFNATNGWVPLYTPEKLEEHLPAALSAFGSAKPPHLTAVVPPNFPLGIDKEFMLTSFYVRGCLRRASLTVSGKRRQVAFCPYCGVTNENAETGLNHVRKHLDVMLVCGGCHTKSVCLGQALQKHMKDNCPAVLAILGKTRGGREISPA